MAPGRLQREDGLGGMAAGEQCQGLRAATGRCWAPDDVVELWLPSCCSCLGPAKPWAQPLCWAPLPLLASMRERTAQLAESDVADRTQQLPLRGHKTSQPKPVVKMAAPGEGTLTAWCGQQRLWQTGGDRTTPTRCSCACLFNSFSKAVSNLHHIVQGLCPVLPG